MWLPYGDTTHGRGEFAAAAPFIVQFIASGNRVKLSAARQTQRLAPGH
jgi:glyoxylase-like metal-dependent hydrolase (beta-lactamase superfamily II)